MITYDDVRGLYNSFTSAATIADRIENKIDAGQVLDEYLQEEMKFMLICINAHLAQFKFVVENLEKKLVK